MRKMTKKFCISFLFLSHSSQRWLLFFLQCFFVEKNVKIDLELHTKYLSYSMLKVDLDLHGIYIQREIADCDEVISSIFFTIWYTLLALNLMILNRLQQRFLSIKKYYAITSIDFLHTISILYLSTYKKIRALQFGPLIDIFSKVFSYTF